MLIAEAGLEACGQRLICQKRVEMHRHFRHTQALAVGRYRRMQIGQRLGIIEPAAFGHKAVQQGQHAIRPVDETPQQFPRVDPGLLATLVKPGLGTGGILRRRQPEEGQEIT